jgi:hypothetical protein
MKGKSQRKKGKAVASNSKRVIWSKLRTYAILSKETIKKKWTEELFIIRHHFLREGIPVYQIKDFEDGNIDGTFYQQELQKVNEDEDKAWKIEKILKRRKRRGVEQALVRWLGWPKQYDSWVDVSEIQ